MEHQELNTTPPETDEQGLPIISDEVRALHEARREASRAEYMRRMEQEKADDLRFKRVLSVVGIILAAALLAGAAWYFLLSPTVRIGDYELTRIDGGMAVTKYAGHDLHPVIPESYLGIPVTVIDENAFFMSRIREVTIPESVTHIDSYAFYSCSNLERVSIPASVTVIGECAFRYCSALTEVNFPDGLTTIGDQAFHGCSSLQTVFLPGSVSSVGSFAFGDCSSLTAIDVSDENEHYYSPDGLLVSRSGMLISCPAARSGVLRVPFGVHSLGVYSFLGCEKLTVIILPDGLTTVCSNAFSHCSSLSAIHFPASLSDFSPAAISNCSALAELTAAKGSDSFMSVDGVLYSADGTVLVRVPSSRSGSFTVSETVNKLYPNAFNGCTKLTDIVLPDTISTIPYGAFSGCMSLESITLPEGIVSIENNAFDQCTALESIALPDSLRSIGSFAFCNCIALKSIELPEGIEQLVTGTFFGCSSLNAVHLPESLKTIGSTPFIGCDSLKELVLPSGLESIDGILFDGLYITVYAAEEPEYYGCIREDNTIWIVEN